ncbi:ATP-dependent DNA helicase pif1 [Linum perenne]
MEVGGSQYFKIARRDNRVENAWDINTGYHRVFWSLQAKIHRLNRKLKVVHRRTKQTLYKVIPPDTDPLQPSLVGGLKEMLDDYNILVKTFRYARERLMEDNVHQLKIKVFAQRRTDGREYDLPTGDELAALIVNDSGQATYEQDIIVEHQNSGLERISVYHPSLMSLQYPLLFPYGEDGWRSDIESCSRATDEDGNGKMLTQCDFYAYRLQTRLHEGHTLLLSGKLFQQYVVNAYALIEAERLEWIRDNQRKLRVHYFNGLMDAFLQVPYNQYLLLRFQEHINLEFCNKSRSIKYLFKYINKPPDRASAAIVAEQDTEQPNNGNSDVTPVIDEINAFLDCRYLAASEACWRIFKFDIHHHYPPVLRMNFHLPGISLENFQGMPVPHTNLSTSSNSLLYDEMQWNEEEMRNPFYTNHDKLNEEQKLAFDMITTAAHEQNGKCFFVEGAGGTGKTFLWKVISAKLPSEGKIVLCVATSGIAALLMEGGRTAHSRFHIPIKLTETSTCDVFHGTEVAELIQQTSLIIWDEAPMAHKYCIEALDRTLRDLRQDHSKNNEERPFGGISVVFGGNFRQILPVIKKGSRSEITGASLKKSYLWGHLTHIKLSQNMRLMRSNTSQPEHQEIAEFDSWLKEIGDGVGCSLLGEANIVIPADLMVQKHIHPIQDIMEATYPDLLQN